MMFSQTQTISSIPLEVFGCTAFVHIHSQYRSKLEPKLIKCIFLGYTPNQKGYKYYFPSNKWFYTSVDVTFFESEPLYPKSGIQGEREQQESQVWDQIG